MTANRTPIVMAVSAAVLMGGCAPSTHTVSWYKQHPKIAEKKAAWCNNDAARVMTAECQNAINANAGIKALGNYGKTGKLEYNVHMGPSHNAK